ncbi:TonB-dependent receptor [Novosphingobium terrae]|uniref:TonB-dependent receptor n=1 Tax=Novosphingobium terrae TaxID=2726189 RepID=UPI001980BC3E|nr:TonB-dependent receptor [Novosphingobium terrae]
MRSIHLAGAAVLALAYAGVAPMALADTASDVAATTDSANPGAPSSRNEIIVTATPFRHTADETPTLSTKIDADQILAAGGASIGDALRDVPGVSVSGFAAGASRPIIRGMDAARVRLLEDGTSSSDVSDIGPDHGIPIDPLAARSIEVVRGAATLRYGSQAIGGVVNTLNNRVPTSLPDKTISAEATVAHTTINDSNEASGLVDGKIGNLALHADGFFRHSDDYGTPEGVQQNSFFHGRGGSVGGSYFLGGGDSHVGLAVTHYDAQYGIPSDTTFIDMRQTKIMSRNSFDLGTGVLKTLNVDGSYANYTHDEKNPDGSINTTFKNKEGNARAELLLNRIGAVRNTAVGFEYQHRDFSAIGEDSSYLNPATSENVAGYIFTEVEVAKALHLEASGRVEHVSVTGTPSTDVFTKRSYTPVSGAIGALFTATEGVKLGLNFSSTGRAPALTELFARGGHDGPQTFETGDPNLKIERANSLELSLRIRKGPFRFDGSLYNTWYKNYIYGDLTGRTCDDDGDCVTGDSEELREVIYRQQGARFRGLEAQATYDLLQGPHGTLTAKVLGDYTRATLDSGSNVPRIPPYRVGGGLNWQSKIVDAGVTFIHYGRQNDYGDYDTATDSYNSLSAQAAVRPFKQYPGVELALIGQNLTNDVQRLATSFNKDLVMMPGRSLRVVLKVATF